jgi:hypothetical protein
MKQDVQMKCYQRSVHGVGQHSGTAPKTDMATRARGDIDTTAFLPSPFFPERAWSDSRSTGCFSGGLHPFGSAG